MICDVCFLADFWPKSTVNRFDNDPEVESVGVITDRLQPIFTDIGNISVVGHASLLEYKPGAVTLFAKTQSCYNIGPKLLQLVQDSQAVYLIKKGPSDNY